MKNQILFTLFTFLFMVPSAYAQNNGDQYPGSMNHVEEESQPDSVTANSDGLAEQEYPNPMPPAVQTANLPTMAEYQKLQDRLDMMEGDIERLLGEQDVLKEKNAMDRLNWSGSYRFNVNLFHLSDHSFDSYPTHMEVVIGANGQPEMVGSMPRFEQVPKGYRDRDEWLAPSWTHRLKLAMTYDFGESLRFYSQLGVYKYFNENVNTDGIIDHGANAYPRDNSFRLERVYFDWFVADWLAISVGRIASPDGPPTELKENTERRSGWGVQMVNATMDTVMTTFYLRDKMYLRAFYSPFGAHMDFEVNNDISLFDDQGLDILHSWGALFETALPGVNDSIFQLGFMHIPKFSPQDVNLHLPGSDMLVSPSEPTGQDLGMFIQASSLILMQNILDIGLDAFVSYNFTFINPTGERMIYDVPMNLSVLYPNGDPLFIPNTPQPLVITDPQQLKFGLASYEEGAGSKNFGHAVYAGLRYTLPWSERLPTRIGGEFNWGSKYHVAWSHPNDQLLNKLGNKGTSFEGYIIQQMVEEHLFCRVGYLELRRNYIGSFIGPTAKMDQRIRNIYLLVDLTW